MRRWLLILLLLIYPFQVSLALADRCCLATPAGITHHAQATDGAQAADDGYTGAADPHCSACSFGHAAGLPPLFAVLPAPRHAMPPPAITASDFASHLPGRPERPQWSAAAA